MKKAVETIVLRYNPDGATREVPIKHKIELHGVPGFAVHRSYAAVDSINPYGWLVSHIDTGFRAHDRPEGTKKKAVAEAEQRIKRLTDRLKITPETLILEAVAKAKNKIKRLKVRA